MAGFDDALAVADDGSRPATQPIQAAIGPRIVIRAQQPRGGRIRRKTIRRLESIVGLHHLLTDAATDRLTLAFSGLELRVWFLAAVGT